MVQREKQRFPQGILYCSLSHCLLFSLQIGLARVLKRYFITLSNLTSFRQLIWAYFTSLDTALNIFWIFLDRLAKNGRVIDQLQKWQNNISMCYSLITPWQRSKKKKKKLILFGWQVSLKIEWPQTLFKVSAQLTRSLWFHTDSSTNSHFKAATVTFKEI